MQVLFMLALAVHVLSGVFWAGSTFVLARTGDGRSAMSLFGPQMGAATIAVLSGALLWHIFHEGYFGSQERVLAIGAIAAIIAAGVQGALIGGARRQSVSADAVSTPVKRAVRGERIAAVLLAITVIAMAISKMF